MSGSYRRDVESLVRTLKSDHGCDVRKTGNSHWRVTAPNGVSITMASTPSDYFALRRIRGDVKRHLQINL